MLDLIWVFLLSLWIRRDGKALQEKAAKKAEKGAGSGDAGGQSTKK